MDEIVHSRLRGTLASKSTEELGQIISAQGSGNWHSDAVAVAKELLLERGAAIPGQDLNSPVVLSGTFVEHRVKAFGGRGRYRGSGTVNIDSQGIRVTGKSAALWAAVLRGLCLGLLIVVALTTVAVPVIWVVKWGDIERATKAGSDGAVRAGIVFLLYFLSRRLGGKRRDVFYTYQMLRGYVANPSKNTIALDFSAEPQYTPVVVHSDNWRMALNLLRNHAPQCDASPQVQA